MGIVSRFPKSWRTDVIVLRGGGRDAKGNPLPPQEIPVTDCIVGARATADPLDRSDVVDSKAVLYRDPDPDFTFLPADRIRVPAGARMAGDWSVDGRPGEWPLGVEVGMVRGLMALQRVRGSRSYKADDAGLREIGTSSAIGDATLAAAQRLAGNALAVGRGEYEATPATVTAGWANERRAGAVVRETRPEWRDTRDAILLRVAESMEVRGK